MTGLLQHLLLVPPPLAYAAVGLLVMAEAAVFVGFVLPGETAAVAGGVLASTGRVSLAGMVVVVVLAAVVGDTVGYEVGRRLGPRLARTRLLARHEDRLDAARETLRHRGGPAVLLGRLTAFLRAVVPALAGASAMPYRRFVAYNAAGALAWGTGTVLAGYLAGASYARVARELGHGSVLLLAAVVAVVAVAWWRRRRRARRASGRSEGDPGPGPSSGVSRRAPR